MRVLASADLHGQHLVYEWLLRTAHECRADAVVLDLEGVFLDLGQSRVLLGSRNAEALAEAIRQAMAAATSDPS